MTPASSTVTFLVLAAVTAPVNWLAATDQVVRRRADRLAAVSKVLFMSWLIAAAIAEYNPWTGATPTSTIRIGAVALLLGLICGLVGDVALLGESDSRFMVGLASFLVGHVAYIVCFLHFPAPAATSRHAGLLSPPSWWWLSLLLVVGLSPAALGIIRGAWRNHSPVIGVAVLVYVLTITLMVVSAFRTGWAVAAVGAALFALSDTVLGINRFARPFRWAPPLVMATYQAGQFLITWAFIVATAAALDVRIP